MGILGYCYIDDLPRNMTTPVFRRYAPRSSPLRRTLRSCSDCELARTTQLASQQPLRKVADMQARRLQTPPWIAVAPPWDCGRSLPTHRAASAGPWLCKGAVNGDRKTLARVCAESPILCCRTCVHMQFQDGRMANRVKSSCTTFMPVLQPSSPMWSDPQLFPIVPLILASAKGCSPVADRCPQDSSPNVPVHSVLGGNGDATARLLVVTPYFPQCRAQLFPPCTHELSFVVKHSSCQHFFVNESRSSWHGRISTQQQPS
jgi:hypothetical protein